MVQRLRKSGKGGVPRVPDGGRRTIAVEMCRARLEDAGDGCGDGRDRGAIHPEGGAGHEEGVA